MFFYKVDLLRSWRNTIVLKNYYYFFMINGLVLPDINFYSKTRLVPAELNSAMGFRELHFLTNNFFFETLVTCGGYLLVFSLLLVFFFSFNFFFSRILLETQVLMNKIITLIYCLFCFFFSLIFFFIQQTELNHFILKNKFGLDNFIFLPFSKQTLNFKLFDFGSFQEDFIFGDFYWLCCDKSIFSLWPAQQIVNSVSFTDMFYISTLSTKFYMYIPDFSWKQFFGISFDGLSLIFVCLTTFIIFLCVCICWYSYAIIQQQVILCLLLLIQFFIVLAFLTLDLLFFYIFFESVLLPLFFLVGMFGSRERRIRAAYYLMFYTLFGSIPFLIGILYIWNKTGLTNILLLEPFLIGSFSSKELTMLWFLFLPGFAFKIPLYPFHLWLPEAHVEAPTVGSVILAGLVLKLGGYGFIRFSMGLFYWGGFEYFNVIYWFCLFSMFCAIFCAACQFDLKRIIAYGSISHMALVTFCIFLGLQVGLDSALLMMVGHGIVSSALFVLVGSIYERFHSRNVRYYGGLYKVLPRFGTFFLIFMLYDISIPTSPGFFAEILALISVTQQSLFFAVLISLQIIIAVGINLLLCGRVLFGLSELRYFNSFKILMTNFVYWCLIQKTTTLDNINLGTTFVLPKFFHIDFKTSDLAWNEVFALSLLFLSAFFIGCYPSSVLSICLFDFELVGQF